MTTERKYPHHCPACRGELALMGQDGSQLKFRCISCGLTFAFKATVWWRLERENFK